MALKVNVIFISIFLLSLFFTFITARPVREVPDMEPDHAQMNGFGKTDRVVDEDSNSFKCNNGDMEEEDEDCLMRRTLAAHVDYIYTQKDKTP